MNLLFLIAMMISTFIAAVISLLIKLSIDWILERTFGVWTASVPASMWRNYRSFTGAITALLIKEFGTTFVNN